MNDDQNNYLLIGVATAVIAGFLIVNIIIGALTAWIWWAAIVALLAATVYAFWMLTRGDRGSLMVMSTPDEPMTAASSADEMTSNEEITIEPTPHATTDTPIAIETVAEEVSPSNEKDDLKIIRGIGPKMEAALHNGGITTYALLSQQTEETLMQVIQSNGMRLAPTLGTWVEQATYAARGDFEGLKTFQEKLSAE